MHIEDMQPHNLVTLWDNWYSHIKWKFVYTDEGSLVIEANDEFQCVVPHIYEWMYAEWRQLEERKKQVKEQDRAREENELKNIHKENMLVAAMEELTGLVKNMPSNDWSVDLDLNIQRATKQIALTVSQIKLERELKIIKDSQAVIVEAAKKVEEYRAYIKERELQV